MPILSPAFTSTRTDHGWLVLPSMATGMYLCCGIGNGLLIVVSGIVRVEIASLPIIPSRPALPCKDSSFLWVCSINAVFSPNDQYVLLSYPGKGLALWCLEHDVVEKVASVGISGEFFSINIYIILMNIQVMVIFMNRDIMWLIIICAIRCFILMDLRHYLLDLVRLSRTIEKHLNNDDQ